MPTGEKVQNLEKILAEYKAAVAHIEPSLSFEQPVEPPVYQALYDKALAIVYFLHDILGKESDLSPDEKKAIGAATQKEMLPYLLQTNTTSRFYTKPLGYAGDYWVIERIYQNIESGSTPFGQLFDRMHLDSATSVAVQNRKELIANELIKHFKKSLENAPDTIQSTSLGEAGLFRILCISCGPAREIFDLYKNVEHTDRLKTTLVDFDKEALAFCQNWRDLHGLQDQIDLVHETILNLIIGRTQLRFEPQDIVYSIGLIDYFPDKHVVRLLDYIHSLLKPNGKVILGNFYTGNVFKEYMDVILEWKLVHRDEADLNRLLLQSKFGKTGRLFFENARINLFVECVK